MRVVKDLLKKNVSGSLKNRLYNILLLCRSTHNSVTKMSPAMYLNGRNYTTLREIINPCHVPSAKNKSIHAFSIGDNVLALNLRPGQKWYNATATEVLGTNVHVSFMS